LTLYLGKYSLAAPDHKVRQCIQRSALLLGIGQMDGRKVPSEARASGSPEGVGFGRGTRSPSPLWSLGALPPKIVKKINFEIAYFLYISKLKWSHLHHCMLPVA